ncbi:MAG: DUF362 domain-containing protein [Oscillospiraceae bacterium]|nr:DUF362 domain-containing protein [Oscillospiraceae bacterium]
MIVVNYGADIIKTAYDTLAASDIGSYLKASMGVSLKPNLVVPCPASDGATTHPEAVEGVILFLRDFGVKSIKIIESSWVGDSTKRAFMYCGYDVLSQKYDVQLIDLKDDSHTSYKYSDFDIAVCDEAMSADFLINMPVLKAHCQTRLTCCMKNLKGCIPDSEKRRFHTLGIHKPVAALSGIIKTGYCVVDGICGDLSFEEGGNPVDSKRIIAGRDPLLIDSYCAELIGYSPGEIGYIDYGAQMGLGSLYSNDTELIELNTESRPVVDMRRDRISDKYKKSIDEDAACSACYSALIYALHRMGGKTRTKSKPHIGQGFKGKSGTGIGIGSCARGFSSFVPGCPPKATEIIEFLDRQSL